MSADLFASFDLGGLPLPNRIVMAPMTRNRATDDHVVQPVTATYYAQRASGGLLITEGVPVSPQGVGYVRVPGIWDERRATAWEPVTRAVHEAGGRIFAQIWHVGRVSHRSFQPDGGAPVSASAVRGDIGVFTAQGPTEASPRARLRSTRSPRGGRFRGRGTAGGGRWFRRRRDHGANGYLLEQFLFSGTNQRTDAYGGSIEGRLRLTLEVVDAVVKALGPGKVGLRISPHNTFNDMHEDDRAGVALALATALRGRGLAYLHVIEPVGTEQPLLGSIKERFGGVIIVNGGFDQTAAEAVLASGQADLVSFGALYLANPDLPERFAEGAALNAPVRDTFYTPGPEGYTDYPTRDAVGATA